jgi:hypothetical protein
MEKESKNNITTSKHKKKRNLCHSGKKAASGCRKYSNGLNLPTSYKLKLIDHYKALDSENKEHIFRAAIRKIVQKAPNILLIPLLLRRSKRTKSNL